MANIKVTCDSTCDLTQALYEKYDIQTLPLGITLGEELHRDGVDIGAAEIFAYADAHGQLPKTSAVSPGDYEALFRELVARGSEVIHINISSEFSSCYQNACLAAAEVGHVHVIDSRNLSSGSGHLAVLASWRSWSGKRSCWTSASCCSGWTIWPWAAAAPAWWRWAPRC